jgi:hypothetical protein
MVFEGGHRVSLRVRLLTYCLVLAAIVGWAWLHRPSSHAVIEVGPVGGSFYQIAQQYKPLFAQHGINLELLPNANSLEVIKDVANPKTGVEMGFEAQDCSPYINAPVATAGRIQLQPLFLFASANIGRRISLDDLRGLKIVMPPAESATSDAAVRMFKLYDITPDNSSFTFMQLTDAAKELKAGKFDAGVFMLAPDNPVIRDLTAFTGLRLVPIPEAKAIVTQLPFLHAIVLPHGIYDIADGVPPLDVPMLAGSVDVVVRKDISPYVLYTLLETMAQVHRGATFLSTAGEYPSISGTELIPHPLALDYYRNGLPWTYRYLPPWLANFVDGYAVWALVLFVLVELYRCSLYAAEVLAGFRDWRQQRRAATRKPRQRRMTPHSNPF